MKKSILLHLIVGLAITSCQHKVVNIKPTYNKGGYAINHMQSESKSTTVVFGQVVDIETNQILSPAIVKMGCLTVQTDESGKYEILQESSTTMSFLTCSFIGYRTIETERFRIVKGDSLKVNFFLVQDDRLLINCEGQE
ncbi:MAG: hypothetical protein KatS3mg032_1548 [Cyclobacteriaceae bacterium]|nr:MAG: hypothetical protein KatS3mg032_1548 [Cyclobacteriaceae bacterium]